MVREIEQQVMRSDLIYIEASGLSTDPKPTQNIATGSLFTEVNTGKVYAFAEGTPGAWYLLSNYPI